MALSASVLAELQRKKSLGIKPTDPTHLDAYNNLPTTTTKTTTTNVLGTTGGVTKVGSPLGTTVKTNPTPTLGQGETLVRKTLNDNGFGDSAIGYDPTRKMVLLNGQDFLSPTKMINGSSAASMTDINNALSSYRNRDLTTKTYDLLGQLKTAIDTPYQAPEFNYDANSDPVYQAALRRAQANAETASGNAMAELNKRGILNSTITGDRLGQIQQAEMSNVSDNILPQLIQQAYGRYRDTVGDQQTSARNRIADLANVLGINSDLVQRNLDNADRDWQNRFAYKQFDQGVKNSDRAYNRGVLESDRSYNRGVLESDRGYNRGVLESDRSFNLSKSNSGADNSRADSSASFGKLMDIWAAKGKAPDGLQKYGINPGDPYKPESVPTSVKIDDKVSTDNYNTIYDDLNSADLGTQAKKLGISTKEVARKLLNQNRDNLNDSDYAKLNSWINDNL